MRPQKPEEADDGLRELLIRTVIRLTFAASGLNAELDRYLKELRDGLKKTANGEALKPELEKFNERLLRLSLEQGLQPGETRLLFGFLLRFHADPRRHNAVLHLQRQCENHYFKEADSLFYALAEALEPSRDRASSAEEFEAQDSAARQARIATETVTRLFWHLFDNLHIPDVFDDPVQAVKASLQSASSPKEYEESLTHAVALMLEIKTHIQSEQQDLDRFLAFITLQLAELGHTVVSASKVAKISVRTQSRLRQSFAEQMKALQLSSTQATKLDVLKEIVNEKLEIIDQEVQQYALKEAKQRFRAERQLEALTLKVKTMEKESKDLKLKLKIANSKALRDPLTGLPNRLAYEERLSTELARCKRYRSPLSLLVWDIDHFKKINDTFGHKAGDKALALIARQLVSNCRATDFICRFGGEEFVMLAPDTPEEPALKLANHLRAIIEKTAFNADGNALAITLSCGVAEFRENDSPETAFDRADRALYQAKQSGRNQCRAA